MKKYQGLFVVFLVMILSVEGCTNGVVAAKGGCAVSDCNNEVYKEKLCADHYLEMLNAEQNYNNKKDFSDKNDNIDNDVKGENNGTKPEPTKAVIQDAIAHENVSDNIKQPVVTLAPTAIPVITVEHPLYDYEQLDDGTIFFKGMKGCSVVWDRQEELDEAEYLYDCSRFENYENDYKGDSELYDRVQELRAEKEAYWNEHIEEAKAEYISKLVADGTLKFLGKETINYEDVATYSFTIPDNMFGIPVTSIGRDDGTYKLFSRDTPARIINIVIPDTVKAIDEYTFSGSTYLLEIDIPASVETIGKDAFSSCSDLQEINFSNGLVEIGEYAFEECCSLKKIVFPDTLQVIKEGAFDSCSELKNIVLPNGLLTIGRRAFYDCYSLAHIEIPESVTCIDKEAFLGCESIKSVTIPGNVRSLDYRTFYDCYALEEVHILEGVVEIHSEAFGLKKEASIWVPESVTFIEDDAFDFYNGVGKVYVKKGSYAESNIENISWRKPKIVYYE